MNNRTQKESEWTEVKSRLECAMQRMAALEAKQLEANNELTDALTLFRQHYELSQEQIAKIMGVSAMYVSLLERKKRHWSARTVQRLLGPLFQL
jgi:DNA-binding transcriptional regulator YiaG